MVHSDKGDAAPLRLEGAQTIRMADVTRAALLDRLAAHPVLEIDCGDVEDVDLSFVQLLLAARASARQANKTIRLNRPASGALRAALERGGFLDAQAAARAFWLATEQM